MVFVVISSTGVNLIFGKSYGVTFSGGVIKIGDTIVSSTEPSSVLSM